MARRQAALRLLDGLLAVVLAVHLARRLGDAFAPPPPLALPPPMEVDLATAPFDRLVLVPGIGAARARAILRDRREHGPVTSRRDLLRVPGIGPATVARLARTRAVGLLAGGRSLGDEDVSSGP